jgi:tRNA-specific 2-thiouridylase
MACPANKRVVVGLSGGVDSSVAAALLLEQGYEVIGATFYIWPRGAGGGSGGGTELPAGVRDAQAVCAKLGIPHHVIEDEERRRQLIDYFAAEYRAGRTPNPCAVCNQTVKFAALLQTADRLGAAWVATGHYARIDRDPLGRPVLKRGLDPDRDQSYFLFTLRVPELARCLMPLGDKTKAETRQHAQRLGLATAAKDASMEICFAAGSHYAEFLRQNQLVREHAGEIVDLEGRVLGQHPGIEFFTIGQRKGLRVAAGRPLYVVDLDPDTNRVIVGDASALERDELFIQRCNWLAFDTLTGPLEVTAQIRYRHRGVEATVTPLADGWAHVKLHQPQRAITPGQACVLYQGEVVIGGGWISRTGPGL